MSSNLTASWPVGLICVSDRRLTDLLTGKIRTNRSTKMTIFECADAHGVIVYNGIGMDDSGLTPSDWLMELAEKKLFDLSIADVLQGIGADLEIRLKTLRAKYGASRARHTFIVAAWEHGAPVVYGLSNYERVDQPGEETKGSEVVRRSTSPPLTQRLPIRINSSGAYPFRKDLQAISDAIKTSASINRVKALCVKAVKDIAYGKSKGKGTVGASCQWALLGPKRAELWFGLDVVGGAIAQEMPNLINIAAEVPLGGTFSARLGGLGQLITDSYAGVGEAAKVARYDPIQKRAFFSELRCGICGSPWPASHRACEVCSYDEHRDRSKRGHRRHGGGRDTS